MEKQNRRQFFKKSGMVLAPALIAAKSAKSLAAEVCGLTPAQTSGPFYPGERNFKQENDLTFIPGHSQTAQGQIVYIKGIVSDQNCRPLKNVNVEIWQACYSGKYNNAKDPNPAALDPHFKYWAETFTDELGTYWFKTIIPGAYPADENWTRPPHIHFRLSKLGYRELVTQMYFDGEVLNRDDLILQDLSKDDQQKLIVDFSPAGEEFPPGSKLGQFNLTLQSIR